MRIVDLTHPIAFSEDEDADVENYVIPLSIQGASYRAICHRLRLNGMSGTYLDFPGHIAEFDDGADAANFALDDLFMLETTVIHLAREGRGRQVEADELVASGVDVKGDALIIHALGEKECLDYTQDTIPYFGASAIEWIANQKIKLFASDIYENKADLQGIFSELFRRGALTVCIPVRLHQLRETYSKCCVIPVRMKGVVQLPCRFFVVEGLPPG